MSAEPDRVAAIEYIADHTGDALATLRRRFADKPLLRALFAAFLYQVQELEDAAWWLLEAGTLEGGFAAHLDATGNLLGFPRDTLEDDEAYRAVLRALIAARRSDTSAEGVIAALAAALGPDGEFEYVAGSASILLILAAPLGYDARPLHAAISVAVPAGVQLELTDPPALPAGLFRFAPRLTPVADSARGLGSATNPAVGGLLTGVVG